MKKSNKMIVTMAVIFMTVLYVVAEPAPASDFEYDLARDNASVVITKYKGTAKNVEIPAQIEGLPVSELNITFYSNKTVENIIIPEGVKELAKGIFESNTSLKSVTIPQSVKSLPDSCFKNCRNLSTVTLSEGLAGSQEISQKFLQFRKPSVVFLLRKNIWVVVINRDVKKICQVFDDV